MFVLHTTMNRPTQPWPWTRWKWKTRPRFPTFSGAIPHRKKARHPEMSKQARKKILLTTVKRRNNIIPTSPTNTTNTTQITSQTIAFGLQFSFPPPFVSETKLTQTPTHTHMLPASFDSILPPWRGQARSGHVSRAKREPFPARLEWWELQRPTRRKL